MYVVRHQTIAKQRERVKLDSLAKQIQLDGSFLIRGENEVASVAALRDVMRHSNRDDTC